MAIEHEKAKLERLGDAWIARCVCGAVWSDSTLRSVSSGLNAHLSRWRRELARK